MRRIQVIDSHTGGEPTRCVVGGLPDLGSGSLSERCERFRLQFDGLRNGIVNEPRGSDIVVGALLVEPDDSECATGVIFFNNVSTLHMCGHGAIGVAVTLAHQGKIAAGQHAIDTPVGRVDFKLHDDLRRVTIRNVPSYRFQADVQIDVPSYGKVVGDIAWGGNWFFLAKNTKAIDLDSPIKELTSFTQAIRAMLERNNITGRDGGLIDHIEVFGPSEVADSKSFVLCPGAAYDRSPCGTGTSAKLACLAADEKLAPTKVWRQESIIGSVFEGSYENNNDGTITPSITGSAWIMAESELLFCDDDPFIDGIRSPQPTRPSDGPKA